MRDIGKNIRLLRQQKNLTQDDLAERLFVTRQTVSNYETGKSRPDVEMLVKVSEALDTDIQQLIYGPEPKPLSPETRRLMVAAVITVLLAAAFFVLEPVLLEYRKETFVGVPYLMLHGSLAPAAWLFGGWTMACLVAMALRKQPLQNAWAPAAGRILLGLLIAWWALTAIYSLGWMVNELLYYAHIRGQWVESPIESNGVMTSTKGWRMLPLPIPAWMESLGNWLMWGCIRGKWLFGLSGAALWLFGKRKSSP